MSLRVTVRSRRSKVPSVCLAGVLAALFDASPARSQPGPTDDGSPSSVSVAGSGGSANIEAAKEQPWFRWEDHPELRFGEARIALRARVQADGRWSAAPIDE